MPRPPHLLAAAMEGIVLFLVLFSAWPFGSVHPYFQGVLILGVALLLALWALRVVLERRVCWVACPIVVSLAGLCVLGIVQILPLNASWVGWLSPATATLQDFARWSPQELANAGVHDVADSGVRTLSFDSGGTRACLLQLVALLALFAAVRNNVRAPGCFYRLAWLCAGNGVLLALVGLGQMVSSPTNLVLWSFHTDGSVFATFICRNHFAYYANLCLGLTAGLLLGKRYFLSASRGATSAVRALLRDPRVLWLAACLVVLFAGLLACLSRGGLFGLICGGGIAGVLLFTRPATPRWATVAAVLVLGVLLIGWLGFDRVSQRWEHLVADVGTESRPTVWLRTLPLVGRFPLVGTGLGTFGLAEPQTRQPGDPGNLVWDHAHNDFLELLVEGGMIPLLTALVVIALVVRQGVRAFLRHADNGLGRLALGGLAGFVAVTVQSFVDFGLHVPAVAVLTAVVAALLANLAEVPRPAADAAETPAAAPPTVRGSILAVAQAAALAGVALFLMVEGHRADQAERYRLAAWRSLEDSRIAYLRSAVALAPERVELRLALTDALVRRADQTALQSQGLAAFVPSWPHAIATRAITMQFPALLEHASDLREARRQAALAQWQSPLSTEVYQRLLKLTARNGRDPTRAVTRLVVLAPSDPAPWYMAGRLALRRGDRVEQFRCWRNALLAGDVYLKGIVGAVPAALSPAELLEQVLPPNPAQIVAAADMLAADSASAAEQQGFLRKALALLQARGPARTGEECLLQARLHARLDEVTAAIAAYETALAHNPRSASWHMELGEYLYRSGRFADARRQLVLVLTFQPNHEAAQALHKQVLRYVAESQ